MLYRTITLDRRTLEPSIVTIKGDRVENTKYVPNPLLGTFYFPEGSLTDQEALEILKDSIIQYEEEQLSRRTREIDAIISKLRKVKI